MIVELTLLHEQAMEAVARAIHDTLPCSPLGANWLDKWCGTHSGGYFGPLSPYVGPMDCGGPMGHYQAGVRCTRQSGTVIPDRLPSLAALWLGHLEAVNDTTLAGIVEATEEAEAQEWLLFTSSTLPADYDGPEPTLDDAPPFDVPAFFAALAVEGIAKGKNPLPCPTCDAMTDEDCCASDCPRSFERVDVPSWFDKRARFTLGIITNTSGPSCGAIRVGEQLLCFRNREHDGQHFCCGTAWTDESCVERQFIIPAIRIGGAE